MRSPWDISSIKMRANFQTWPPSSFPETTLPACPELALTHIISIVRRAVHKKQAWSVALSFRFPNRVNQLPAAEKIFFQSVGLRKSTGAVAHWSISELLYPQFPLLSIRALCQGESDSFKTVTLAPHTTEGIFEDYGFRRGDLLFVVPRQKQIPQSASDSSLPSQSIRRTEG